MEIDTIKKMTEELISLCEKKEIDSDFKMEFDAIIHSFNLDIENIKLNNDILNIKIKHKEEIINKINEINELSKGITNNKIVLNTGNLSKSLSVILYFNHLLSVKFDNKELFNNRVVWFFNQINKNLNSKETLKISIGLEVFEYLKKLNFFINESIYKDEFFKSLDLN